MFNNIRHLRYVVAVADHGSLYVAAREGRVSESAISAAIKSCEETLGYSVFMRQPAKPLRLTPMGAEFIRDARRFLEQAEGFFERSVGLGNELKGAVRLGCYTAIAPLMLPPVMKYCQEIFPQVTLRIAEHDLPEIVKRVRNGDIEIAITYDLLYDNDVSMHPIFPVWPHIVVARTNRLAKRSSISLAELVDEPLALIQLPVTQQHILKLFTDRGLSPRVAHYATTMETLHALVADDLGYSVYFVKPNTDAHGGAGLARLHIEEDVPPHHLAVALAKHAQPTVRATEVARACETVLGNPSIAQQIVHSRQIVAG